MSNEIKDENSRMRLASGNKSSNDPLAIFLYLLVRDALPFGTVERLLDQATKPTDALFTNGWAAAHVEDMVKRLTTKKVKVESN